MQRITRLLVLAWGLFALASSAYAADEDTTQQVEALAARANAAYRRGAYEEAVATYLEAYQLASAAALLYNIALIYDRKLADPQLASDFYRRYVSAPDADPPVVRRAMARIRELRTEERRGPAPVEPLEDDGAGGAHGSRTTGEPKGARRRWGWITLGVGGALLAGGTVTGLLARNDSNAFGSARTPDAKRELADRGSTLALTTDLLFGVGIAAAATGAVLLLTDHSPASSATRGLQLGAAPMPGGAALVIGGGL